MDLVLRLKSLRKSYKLSQQELANRLNLNRVTYSQYETGRREPDLETLQKIADFYKVSLDYLTGLTEDANEQQSEYNSVSDADLRKTLEALRQKKGRWGQQPLDDEQQEMLANIIEAVLKRREDAATKDHL